MRPPSTRAFIAKAIVTFPMPPEVVADRWKSKTALLEHLGVLCARIYSVMAGVVYQDFLTVPLAEHWRDVDEDARQSLGYDLARIAGVLDACGFSAVTFLADIRMRDGKPCLTDLGSDIGEPNVQQPESRGLAELRGSIYWQKENGVKINEQYRASFVRSRALIGDP